ncbi:unnamed protein product [Leptidea sinapis]|uniref:Coiled-coil domain-containing protein 13 n=1 Tax=Leptidea sinapis TaxID=189913 RepID=A0A5E4Q3M5_9NEOP|nr:unnamed protein product [Leptidea sinapis]
MEKRQASGGKVRSKTNLKGEKNVDLAAKIDETDEMKLKMLAGLDKPDPDDILYPPELNAHLIEQMKIMTGENNELRKCVFTKDEEIKELKKTVLDLNQRIRDIISGSGPAISSKSAGIISAKITELCKQNRHLVAEVESYKTKNATLERKIMQLDIINKENEKLDACLCKEEPIDASYDELKELNSKLNVVNKKLCDSKNRNLELKNEILIATKILQKELGEKFTSIKDLQNDLAGWKGRAQQIVLLQARINDLEQKLNGKQKDLNENYDELKEDNVDLKRKLEGARCRIRNLECDATTIRQKMQTFIEKSEHDDLLINEQRVKNLEAYYQEMLKDNTVKMNKMQNEILEYQKSIKNTDAKIDALREQSTEKATKIEELRAQLLRYEECSLQSVFFTPMKTATDNEIKKLTELVITLNERLDLERHKWEELDTSHRKTKERKRRLEKKLNLLESEIKNLKDSRRASKSSKSVLQKEIETTTVLGAHSVTKKQSSVTGIVEKSSETISSETQSDGYESMDKDELKYKLELADEKLKIMEDKLKMIEEEKQDDYNHLTEMVKNSKQLFHEALAVLKRDKCQCVK